jgi:hypothetical protein
MDESLSGSGRPRPDAEKPGSGWIAVGRRSPAAALGTAIRRMSRTAQASSAGPAGERFDRFTERAKKVLVLAQEEAQRLNHNYIGTEHLLLGLVKEERGVGARVLGVMGIELEKVREAVEFIVGRGDRTKVGDISLTPRAKRVIELAVEEARELKHNYVGTEHLLLGLVREGEGIAAGVLESLGATMAEVRKNVLRVVRAGAADRLATRENAVTCRVGEDELAAIDMLVEAGIRSTRSDAAQWLIHAGIAANRPLFERVEGTVAEIRRLRGQAQAMAEMLASKGGTTPPAEPADEAIGDTEGGGEAPPAGTGGAQRPA